MSSYQYRESYCGDKTILRPSYLHNGISYTGEKASLYWIRAPITKIEEASAIGQWVKIMCVRVAWLMTPPSRGTNRDQSRNALSQWETSLHCNDSWAHGYSLALSRPTCHVTTGCSDSNTTHFPVPRENHPRSRSNSHPFRTIALLHGNTFHMTDPLWGESIGRQWFSSQKPSHVELWCYLSC